MPPTAITDRLRRLVAAWRGALVAAGRGDDAREFETHISHVLLAGDGAWKFKKAVDFGFVDFSTPARRRLMCEREVMRNRRFAPGLYLGVETVAAGGEAEPAVRMRRFDPAQTLDHLVPRGKLPTADIEQFARRLAALHRDAPAATEDSWGSMAVASAQITASAAPPVDALLAGPLRARLAAALDAAAPRLAARRAAGFVRECHGDLHLANVVKLEGRLVAFDCIEFDDALATIDTLSDAAFFLMDLDRHGAHGLGHAFFNAYLEASGDHAGLVLLPLYLAYRALVRAKVTLLGADAATPAGAAARVRALAAVALAERYLDRDRRPGLVITHGVSGSGKTHLARRLAAALGYLHLRSDVERKRLAGLDATARSGSAPGGGLYSAQASRATYDHLHRLAGGALEAGFSVVVDAAFLEWEQRARFAALAARHRAPFHLLAPEVPVALLRERVAARAARGDDASEATLDVLERQLLVRHVLDADERARRLGMDEAGLSTLALEHRCGAARAG